MNHNIIEMISGISQDEADQFLAKTASNMVIETDAESVDCDFSWLPMIEECIPNLDNLIRKPRKFIAQEEEIVPIERAKKITEESVKHLSQHTDYIQSVDEKGNITPNKILQIRKEETFDLYENRFVNSLLKNLYGFLNDRVKNSAGGSFSKCERKVTYNGETTLKHEKIKITLKLETDFYENRIADDPSGLSLPERIERLQLIILDFMKSPFIKELANALPVRSPIRKTNAILKNTDLKKALELWEFIERYQVEETKMSKENSVVDDNKEVREKFDTTYFINYDIINSIGKSEMTDEEREAFSKDYLTKIVEDYVDENEVDYKEFKRIINIEFQNAYRKKQVRHNQILNKYNSVINKYNSNLNKAMELLKE